MMAHQVREAHWVQLSEFVADKMGLYFPPGRHGDLQRAIADAARDLGFEGVAACVEGFLSGSSTRAHWQVLANHLTVGETYFFRDLPGLQAFTAGILPELVRGRRGRDKRLRLWSAACCTGEEPYTLAILLHEALPDLSDWQVTITATDINAEFLKKAVAGRYGEWSFRNAPPWLKQRYFSRAHDGSYLIAPRIRKLVTFEHLNLAQDVFPSLVTDTNAMDVIFCRNVLMYFTPSHIGRVLGNFQHALVDGGWLLVGPSEASHELLSRLAPVSFPGAIAYRKDGLKIAGDLTPPHSIQDVEAACPELVVAGALQCSPSSASGALEPTPGPPGTESGPEQGLIPEPLALAQSLYQQGAYAEATETILATFTTEQPDARTCSLLAHALANQGKLAEALVWCDRWIAIDRLVPGGHYLRAVVLLEGGQQEEAQVSLQRVTYLAPDFVLAHVTLGHLARRSGKAREAVRHFTNAQHLLERYRPDDLLPESDGLTAGRLVETLAAISEKELLF